MTISDKIRTSMDRSSWVRKMFEEGRKLKAQHGADKVFDFSIGNPNLPPPDEFSTTLIEMAGSSSVEAHSYTSQYGYPQACEAVASFLSEEQGVPVTAKEVVMTFGAAGALNVILKTLLDPGDEVILTKPVFVDYQNYVENHGGVSRIVECREDFMLDLDAIEASINKNTKAMIINSPNNPSGQIYSEEILNALGVLLEERSKRYGRTIYLLSDEPYRKIVFDDHVIPSLFRAYAQSIIATSYSKDLSIPGERIGFAAVCPDAEFGREIVDGMALAAQMLGFINAPMLMQRVVSKLQGFSTDMEVYHRKRELLCKGLSEAGYSFMKSPGTFYLFPRTPIEDDVAFVMELQKELILTVPGKGFLYPGHFRIAFCVEDDVIVNSMDGFKRVMDSYT